MYSQVYKDNGHVLGHIDSKQTPCSDAEGKTISKIFTVIEYKRALFRGMWLCGNV